MKTSLVRCMTMVAITFWVSSAAANSIDVDLEQVSGTSELSGQLQLTIFDNAQGSGNPTQVLFSFSNGVGIPSSIQEIFIDGEGLFSSVGTFYQSAGVDFTNDGGNPFGFSAGSSAAGIDRAGEALSIVFNLESGVTLANIIGKLDSGEPFITIPDPGGDGPPYINKPVENNTNPVPEPASLVLFGIGTAGLAGFSKRRRNNK